MSFKRIILRAALCASLLPAASFAQTNANNSRQRPPRPQVSLPPDLTIKSAKYIEVKDSTQAIVVVANAGKGSAPKSRIRLDVFKGVTKESGVKKYYWTDVPPLKPGEETTVTFEIAPDKFAGGARLVTVDPDNKVKESDETNNESFTNFPAQGFK
ncbi:MAG: hypothetical protein LC746_15810 [Acidobacteria bacterium]|nr:hypothetical protein [Acidobacteriota bacterium]